MIATQHPVHDVRLETRQIQAYVTRLLESFENGFRFFEFDIIKIIVIFKVFDGILIQIKRLHIGVGIIHHNRVYGSTQAVLGDPFRKKKTD